MRTFARIERLDVHNSFQQLNLVTRKLLSGGVPFQQIEKNLTHPTNWKLKVNYPYPSVQVDGCPSKQYDRVVSYWFRRGDEQFDKLGRV